MHKDPIDDETECADTIKLEKPEPEENDLDQRHNDHIPFLNFLKKPSFFVWLIVLILLFIVAFFTSGGKDLSKADFNALMKRVDRIEARIHDMGGMEERITAEIQAQKNTIGKDVTAAAGAGETTAQKIDLLTKKVELLQQRMDSVVKEPQVNRTGSAPRVETNRPKYHVVARGETLYRIAMKYGLAVDALRSLNQMGSDQSIYPGQKLLVSAAKGS